MKKNKLCVMMHGLGSDGADMHSLSHYITGQDVIHFFAPNAIEKYDLAPYGYQWFSKKNIENSDFPVERLRNNIGLIKNLINKKQKELNITNDDTILMGFSQGAMVTLYLALHEQYACAVSFAGRLLLDASEIKNTTTPICIIHGIDDDVIPAQASEEMCQIFKSKDIKHEKLIIDNLNHSIDIHAINFANQFIKRYVK